MKDISRKSISLRKAEASGKILLQPHTLALIKEGKIEKGDVLSCARIAAIMAAKKVSEIIPLCHPIHIDAVEVNFSFDEEGIKINVSVKANERTGVEMEALFAVTVAALTVYDMCKGVDEQMRIEGIRLLKKEKSEDDRS